MINVYKSIMFTCVLVFSSNLFFETTRTVHRFFPLLTIYSIFMMLRMFVNELSSLPYAAIIIEKGDKHLFKTDTNLFAPLKFQLFPILSSLCLFLASYKKTFFYLRLFSLLLLLVCFCHWDEPSTHASLPAFKTIT